MSSVMSAGVPFVVVMLMASFLLAGCGVTREPSNVTVTQVEALESFDSLLPVGADSVVRLYQQNDPAKFRVKHRHQLEDASLFIDSLNNVLKINPRIDTLAIDHSFENFGNAACSGRSIFISSSYFLLYDDPSVIRSVITHEFGHKIYQRLSDVQRLGFEELWVHLGNAALLYLFRDGEYSGNAWFGGHPYESPTEFFASAFNLFNNKEREIAARLQYVNKEFLPLIDQLKTTIHEAARKQ